MGTGLVSKSTSLGHCFVFLRKAPCSHVVSLSTFMGDNKFTAGGNPVMDLHPIWNGVEIVLVATETWISFGGMGNGIMQIVSYLNIIMYLIHVNLHVEATSLA